MISILLPSHLEPNAYPMMVETEKEFPGAQVIICTDRYRKGKGWAVREALAQATGDIIVFLDADMDIHPHMIKRLLPHLEEFDIVVGRKDSSKLLSRWIITQLSRLYIRIMFGIPVDTQTGIKAFRRSALPEWAELGFAFSLEVLAKAQRAGASMYEVKIDVQNSKRTSFRAVFYTLIGSLKIWLRLRR